MGWVTTPAKRGRYDANSSYESAKYLTMQRSIREYLEAFVLALSGLLVALAFAWQLLSVFNFSYPIWHDHASIGWAIEEYGGQNRYKKAFDQTTREQRVELFAGIIRAVNKGGEGLAELEYTVPGYPPQTLLRPPEVVHLQDVANLVTQGRYVAVFALLIWMGLWFSLFMQGKKAPSLGLQMATIGGFVGVVGVAVVLIGAKAVFYKMHEWIFPDNHEWFFYYQDSLMATMMYAPNLFAWIAVEWLLLSMCILALIQLGMDKLLTRLQ